MTAVLIPAALFEGLRMGCCNPRSWEPICVGCPSPPSRIGAELGERREAMARRKTIIATCARCQRERGHKSRGLCDSCYMLTSPAPYGDGTRDNYPLRIRQPEHLVEDYEFLRGQGMTHGEIATRLNRTPAYLRVLVKRAAASTCTQKETDVGTEGR